MVILKIAQWVNFVSSRDHEISNVDRVSIGVRMTWIQYCSAGFLLYDFGGITYPL